jgi:hypothetical protein
LEDRHGLFAGVDKLMAKRLVRRNDQQSTIKPRDLKLLWG